MLSELSDEIFIDALVPGARSIDVWVFSQVPLDILFEYLCVFVLFAL
jgi:hypothetical protein